MKRFLYIILLIVSSSIFVSCGGNGTGPESNINLRPDVGFKRIGNFIDFDSQIFVPQENVRIELIASKSARGDEAIEKIILTVMNSSGQQVLARDLISPFETVLSFPTGGSYTLSAVAVDEAGRRSIARSQQVTVDNQAPATTRFVLSVDGVIQNVSTQPIRVNKGSAVRVLTTVVDSVDGVSTPTFIALFVDGDEKLTSTGGTLDATLTTNGSDSTSDQFIPLSVGTYTVAIYASDGAGNVSQVRQFTLQVFEPGEVDITPPTVTITQPQGGAKLSGAISLQAQIEEAESDLQQVVVSDNGNVIFVEDSVNSGFFSQIIDTASLEDGAHVWRVVANNADGLPGQAQVEVLIDNTKPALSWRAPLENETLTGETVLRVYASDANGIAIQDVTFMIGPVQLEGNVENTDSAYSLAVNTATLGLTDGTYTLKATVKDSFGNSESIERLVGISNTDTTAPVVDWVKPLDGASISGIFSLEVDVSDRNNDSELTDVSEVNIFAGSELIGEAVNTIDNIWRVSWNTTTVVDGGYTLTALAADSSGNKTEESINVTVSNAIPLEVSLSLEAIEPPAAYEPSDTVCAAELAGVQLPCYTNIISIPVTVNDETGTAAVTLIVESAVRGKAPISVDTTAPYIFTLDTSDYPNDDSLQITAIVKRSSDSKEITSGAVNIGIYNQYPLPTIAITSPSSGDVLGGLVDVSMNVSQPNPTSYTLDLDQDEKVDSTTVCVDADGIAYTEGLLVQFVDYTNRVIDEQYVDLNVEPDQSGSYVTAEPFPTIDFANDSYVIRLQVVLRNKGTSELEVCAGESGTVVNTSSFITLTRTIEIETENTNKVPPALLITSPVNVPSRGFPNYGLNGGFVTFNATDNTGIAHVELRVFAEDDSEPSNNTPSRYVCNAAGLSALSGALPISPDSAPYLPNADNYTVRVIAQDVDGNRTQQEVNINIQRDTGSTPTYVFEQVGPIVQVEVDDPVNPGTPERPKVTKQRLVLNPVPKNVSYTLDLTTSAYEGLLAYPEYPSLGEIFPRRSSEAPSDAAFTHIWLNSGICGGTPLSVSSSSSSLTYANSDAGVYTYQLQVRHPDNSVYLSNVTAVSVGSAE